MPTGMELTTYHWLFRNLRKISRLCDGRVCGTMCPAPCLGVEAAPFAGRRVVLEVRGETSSAPPGR